MKTILITGATSGIGEELAKQLSGNGRLLLTGRNEVKLFSLKNELEGPIEILPCDLSHSIEPILSWIRKEKPDLIFNNAGFGIYGDFDQLSVADIEEMIDVNCTTISQITRTAILMWKKQGKEGTIMNISSAASFFTFPLGSLYGATKAFVTHLTKSLDAEYRSSGIRILASCPGMVDTNFSARASKNSEKMQRLKGLNYLVMSTPYVAKKILKQVRQKKTLSIIDWKYSLLNFISKLIPSNLAAKTVSTNLKKRL